MLASSLDPTRLGRRLALVLLVPLAAGCAATVDMHRSSPWQYGGAARLVPGLFDLGHDGATLHPTLSYAYLPFDGGNDRLLEVGAQVRKPLEAGTRPFWIGGEATFSRLRTELDSPSPTQSFNGWSATALIGLPIRSEQFARWSPSVFAGAGISDYGAQGWNLRIGLDVQPDFLGGN